MLFKPCFSVLNRNRSRSGGLSALVMGHVGHSFYFIAEISYTVFLIQLLLFFFFSVHYSIAANLVLKGYPSSKPRFFSI